MKTILASALVVAALLPERIQAAVFNFTVPMSGAQEAPGPGDADGVGTAVLSIDSVLLTIDWDITVSGIDLPPTNAHIHQGPAGVPGPVRVDFSGQLHGTGLFDADLAGVLANPTGWYVNVHNASFPAGAIRGQLPAPEGSPGIWAIATGLGLAWFHRRKMR